MIFLSILNLNTSCSNEDSLDARKVILKNESSMKPSYPIQSDKITIGNQVWMLKNLSISRYRNGDIIPQVQDQSQWFNLTTGAWCYYANYTPNGIIYGKLYNWYAVNDERNLAPQGWRIPSNSDFMALRAYLGPATSGKNMKATILWDPNTGDNTSHFTALPSGWRSDTAFNAITTNAIFWTTTETGSSGDDALGHLLVANGNQSFSLGSPKIYGYSVRCIKD